MRRNLPIAIGRRIRELRNGLRISQEELAARADLHRNYVGSVERGERDIGITAMEKIVGALGMALADFFAPFRDRPKPRRGPRA